MSIHPVVIGVFLIVLFTGLAIIVNHSKWRNPDKRLIEEPPVPDNPVPPFVKPDAADLEPVQYPPPEPEPSCLAKGIARSLVETPEEWIVCTEPSGYYGRGHCLLDAAHVRGIRLIATGYEGFETNREQLKGCSRICSLTVWAGEAASYRAATWAAADLALIAQTIEAHPLLQLKAIVDAERAQQAAIDHFSSLGCPTAASVNQSSNPSSTS